MAKKQRRNGYDRTPADEYKLDQQLRREEAVKTEVIAELRLQNQELWRTQARLLQTVLMLEESLRIYRTNSLVAAKQIVDHQPQTHCVPGCTRHRWDDKDGWHRTDEFNKV